MSYVSDIRKKIGNDLLMGIGSGVIIEQDGKILLQNVLMDWVGEFMQVVLNQGKLLRMLRVENC